MGTKSLRIEGVCWEFVEGVVSSVMEGGSGTGSERTQWLITLLDEMVKRSDK